MINLDESQVTITYTTVRTVGIGSYVLRLGQRAVMHDKSSIILTGYHPNTTHGWGLKTRANARYNALNKLLGSDVYTSNQQLGGLFRWPKPAPRFPSNTPCLEARASCAITVSPT